MPRNDSNDVYNRQVTFGDPISADSVAVTMDALNTALQACTGRRSGLLVQSLQMQYSQQLSQLYDITSTDVTTVVGRPSGAIQMNRVIGRQSVSEFFYEQYGDACRTNEASSLEIQFKQGFCSTSDDNAQQGSAVVYRAHHVIINNTTISTQAQQAVVNEAFALTTSKLTKTREEC
jgi:hypothetical protein